MSQKTEITESEWLRVLEELHPKPPENGRMISDIARNEWHCHVTTAYERLCALENKGLASRIKIGTRVYWTLHKKEK